MCIRDRGITVGEAFRRFADGTGSPDAQDVAIALDVQNEVGGHEAEVVQEIADNIHERIMTRQEIKSIFSSTTSMVWIMDFIPIGVILFFSITNKSYVDVFFGNYIYTGILVGMIIMMIILSLIHIYPVSNPSTQYPSGQVDCSSIISVLVLKSFVFIKNLLGGTPRFISQITWSLIV